MDSTDKKIIYGSLADYKIAESACREMAKIGVTVDIETDESGMHHLYVTDEKDLPVAVDHFRVLIGVKKPIEIDPEWEKIQKLPMGNFTFSILIVCILIYFFGYFMEYADVYNMLMFGPPQKELTFVLIEAGQLWRLMTPALIHFGFMHILFNLMWWKDLGNILENTKGPFFLLLFLVSSSAFSNFFQAFFAGPNFGGLSGVVYALLGYLWIYSRVNKESEFSLPKRDVVLMIGWFFLCLFDVFSFSAANWAHGAGLVFGMGTGLVLGLKDRN
ncbi:rhomboid family intramembrane serine protease [Bacteriovorax sp. Seq25_V]|uniref:rhomboid family intramembrane serine protease n=1 Tax=Bacteriovorax sp. Seq25_V TaxID=1201288 RepID=UPI00038A1C61|nr:rhomboid family intramembrane serine protease [Bacteriovorax sp. Seq25_V]EQC46146.1 peptidase, S54 family [Bacteriovorax sp. Seq25_V]